MNKINTCRAGPYGPNGLVRPLWAVTATAATQATATLLRSYAWQLATLVATLMLAT